MQKHWQKMATVTNIIGIKIIKSFPQEVISGIDSVEIATIKTHTHTQKSVQIFFLAKKSAAVRTWKLCLPLVSVLSSE